jgi:MFS family permease
MGTELLSPLANRTFRRLFLAQVSALLGTGLSTVALALLAYELAGGQAGTVLGTALALKMVAYVVIAPLVGGFAHRLPRRPLLVTLDVLRAALVLWLPWVTETWHIYLLIFLINSGSAAFTPLFQATLPDVLSDEGEYTRALSLSRLAYDLENMLSPTLAALVLGFWSFDALFAANGVGFLASALLLLSVRLPAPLPAERPPSVLFNLSFGVRSYLATPRLRALWALHLAVAVSGAMVIVNSVVYVRAYLGGGERETAYILMAAGFGSMTAALLLPRLLQRWEERPVMLAGGVLASAALGLGVFLPAYPALASLWFLIGVGGSLIQTPAGRVIRRSCRESDRGAFFSANFALSHGCWMLAYLATGWLGSSAGLATAFAVLATSAALATGLAQRLWPSPDQEVLEHVHEELSHEHPHRHDEHHQHTSSEHPATVASHSHAHHHAPLRHAHPFVIDLHHSRWPEPRK